MSDTTRASAYGVIAAVLSLLTTVGVTSEAEAAQYGATGSAILGVIALVVAAVKTFKQRGREVDNSQR